MAGQLDLSKVVFPDLMSVWEAAIYTGSGEMRIRSLIRKGTLPAVKTDHGTRIAKTDLDTLKANPPARAHSDSVRGDGKAFVIHVKAGQLTAVQDFLKSQGIELELKNKPSKKKLAELAAKSAAKVGATEPGNTAGPAQASVKVGPAPTGLPMKK